MLTLVGMPSANSQAEGHPLTSYKNLPRILELFQESWRILQDFKNLSNNLGEEIQYGVY